MRLCAQFSFFAGVLSLYASTALAQSFSGKIIDGQDKPLAAVNVIIPALQLVTATDADGKYFFKKIPSGSYTVEFFILGYEREVQSVKFSSENVKLNVTLHESPL